MTRLGDKGRRFRIPSLLVTICDRFAAYDMAYDAGKMTSSSLQLPQIKRLKWFDVGTGTGVGAVDFAKPNPSFRVIGVNLSMV